MITEIDDMDYRSYALPCYPFEGQQKERIIKQFEDCEVAEILDMDYCLPSAPYNLPKWQLAA
jgi:hypothetical protein